MHLEAVLVLFDFLANLLNFNFAWGSFRSLTEILYGFFIDLDIAERRGPFLARCRSNPIEIDFVRRSE